MLIAKPGKVNALEMRGKVMMNFRANSMENKIKLNYKYLVQVQAGVVFFFLQIFLMI